MEKIKSDEEKHHHHHRHHHHHHNATPAAGNATVPVGNATKVAGAPVVVGPVSTDPKDVEEDARNAKNAAITAQQASKVAHKVAAHSIDITKGAQSALNHARDALHGARVDSTGLSEAQKESLRRAEEKLRAATKKADYGKLTAAEKLKALRGISGESEYETDEAKKDRLDGQLAKLEDKESRLRTAAGKGEGAEGDEDVSSMRSELRALREQLAAKKAEGAVVDTKGTVTTKDDVSVEQMESQLREYEELIAKSEKTGEWQGDKSPDEVKAEMERLRQSIARAKAAEPESEAEMRARLTKMEELREGHRKEAEVEATLRKLRAMKAAGQPIPEGSPSEEELESLLKRLRARDAELERELGMKDDAELDSEIMRVRQKLGIKGKKEGEYGTLKYEMGGKKKMDDEESVDLDEWKKMKGARKFGGGGKTLPSGTDVEVDKGRFDVDTEMPYGELEPFGREDTAQELTENAIKQSDEMVDQLERAEVAEEKRSVFRSLTRLRGAAITSFDGVARSQTGNIDEYNKVHQWRVTHPLHHLADEESDISKWAFPDNADFFIQKKLADKRKHEDKVLAFFIQMQKKLAEKKNHAQKALPHTPEKTLPRK